MSSAEQEFYTPPPSHPLVNSNTTARSIMSEQSDRRLIPEDLRTRRFGYNPGFWWSADPVNTGLQVSLVEAGVAILFETGPVKRQRHSVDPNDRSPLDIDAELLAGEGLNTLIYQRAHMGAVELLPLRGKTDMQAGSAFAVVHPSLAECVENKLIPKCPYAPLDLPEWERHVCISCRLLALEAIKDNLPEALLPLFSVVRQSNSTGQLYMQTEWNKWVSEVASTKAGVVTGRQLGALNENHMRFMRQLHERTPNEQELARIAMQTEGNASALRESMALFAEQIAARMPQQDPNAAQELVVLRAQMANMQEQFNELMKRATQGTTEGAPKE